MNYRTLGNTQLRVSEIGFGAWGIGGTSPKTLSYGPTEDAVSKAALERALEQGITFYDTADLYGEGKSESLIGEVFKKKRGQVVIASKAGFLGVDEGQDFSVSHLQRSLEASLRRLQTDYLDLYQLHDPSFEELKQRPEIPEFLERMKKEGKIRASGLSLRSPAEGLEILNHFRFDCFQVNFNLTDQRALEDGLMPACRERGVGIICRTPLCFGFLTGRYRTRGDFHRDDHRNRYGAEQLERWAGAPKVYEPVRLRSGARQTDAQFAIRFCLSFGAVSTVIPGMMKPEEVDENAAASGLGALGREELHEIETLYQRHTFFDDKR